jgi:methyl-accepting chemotaxis protein
MAFFKTNTAGQPKANKPAALSAPKPTLEAPKPAAPKTEAPAKPAQAEKPADKPTETAKSITPPPPPSADEWEDF